MYQNRHFIVNGRRFGRLHVETDQRFKGFEFRFDFGHGAGNGGITFFFAVNAINRKDLQAGKGQHLKPIQLGFTRNANHVPYVSSPDQMLIKHAFNFGKHE